MASTLSRARKEHDRPGQRESPDRCCYGIQTLRAVEHFPITGVGLAHYPETIHALAAVKMAGARANREPGIPSAPAAAGHRTCLPGSHGRKVQRLLSRKELDRLRPLRE